MELSVCFRIAGVITEKNTGKKLIEKARPGPQKKFTLLPYRPVLVMSTFPASQRCPIGQYSYSRQGISLKRDALRRLPALASLSS